MTVRGESFFFSSVLEIIGFHGDIPGEMLFHAYPHTIVGRGN